MKSFSLYLTSSSYLTGIYSIAFKVSKEISIFVKPYLKIPESNSFIVYYAKIELKRGAPVIDNAENLSKSSFSKSTFFGPFNWFYFELLKRYVFSFSIQKSIR